MPGDSPRQLPDELIINKIRIFKPDETSDSEGLIIIPPPEKEGGVENVFATLSLRESIFSTGITGVLKFKETGSVGDRYNFVGNEMIEIDIETPPTAAGEIENAKHNLKLCVSSATFIGDEASDSLSGPAARAGVGWELDLVACESYLLDASVLEYMDSDYIGKIHEFVQDNIAEKYFNSDATPFSNAANDMEIEPTTNSIWLKKNHNMYPWGKDVHSPTLINLMNNICENSVTEDEKGVNYLFYQDFDGWHFKSIRKMIADSDTTWGFGLFGAAPRNYVIADADVPEDTWKSGDPRIQTFRMLSEYDHMNCFKNGAYSSYYELVKPNYDDPYFQYLDFSTTHQKTNAEDWGQREIVSYDYHEASDIWGDQDDGGRVEEYKLIPDSNTREGSPFSDEQTQIEEIDPGNVDKKSKRVYDESNLYGYFSSPYNYDSYALYDHLGGAYTEGKTGKTNDVMWQTMFDQTDLKADTIKTIMDDIKTPTREAIKEYTELKNLKEKWNVYRYSICCDKESMEKYHFFAVIDSAEKIQESQRTAIYEYSWREVELWPKDNIEDTVGEVITPEDSPITVVAVEDGLEGVAYNVNELMNIEDGENVYSGPGINVANDNLNDYPNGYQMMPVGGYFRIEDGPTPDICDELGEGETNVYYHKHIVQMYRIPNHVLQTIVPEESEEPDPEIPTDVYIFDVPNAHDGICSC